MAQSVDNSLSLLELSESLVTDHKYVPGALRELSASFLEKEDSNLLFSAIYFHTACRIRDCIRLGVFEHTELMAEINLRFYHRYTRAKHNWDIGLPVCSTWEMAFNEARLSRITPLRQLFLGVNAHINYDLPIVVSEAVDSAQLTALKTDFLKVGQILQGLYPFIVSRLMQSGLLRTSLPFNTGWGYWLINQTMKHYRKRAWQNCNRLTETPAHQMETVLQKLDEYGVATAKKICRHPLYASGSALPLTHTNNFMPLKRLMD